MTNAILVLNAGSSSLKFAVYPAAQEDCGPLIRGKIAGIGTKPVFSARDTEGRVLPPGDFAAIAPDTGADDLIPDLMDWLAAHLGAVTLIAAGHRVVHGGREHRRPVLLTRTVRDALQTLIPLAPMHQPHNLSAIASVAAKAPELPQVACFDTSFHQTQDPLAQMFALPRALTEEGVIRYGFHGLSYEYIANVLPRHLGQKSECRIVVAHLGSGASMCAMKSRHSVATSMGFTALEGLVMGRRCGTLDPGVLLYLMQEKGMTAEQIATLLYRQSGLLGVSGVSNDMSTLEASDVPAAKQAIELFCFRAAREVASLAATIQGLDALVFTAGIGENSALVRARICEQLGWMGVKTDAQANARNAARISPPEAAVDVLVIPTDEEAVIAQATRDLTRAARTMERS